MDSIIFISCAFVIMYLLELDLFDTYVCTNHTAFSTIIITYVLKQWHRAIHTKP